MAFQFTLFAVGTAVIFYSGSRLPVHGKVLADRLGISASAVGLFVLAIITSLPELSVTLSAMLAEKAPNLALGNILGSNNFNLATIAGLEFALVGGGLLARAHGRRFSRTCLLVLVMTAISGLGVVYGLRVTPPPVAIILFSLPVVAVYVVDSVANRRTTAGGGSASDAGAALHLAADDGAADSGTADSRGSDESRPSTATAAVCFAVLSALVVAAGVVISRSATAIAEHPFGGGIVLGHTFVGTLLVAIATSLPEVTVAAASVRGARSPDMAVGTLLGSNSINLLVFAVGAPLLLTSGRETAWSSLDPVNLINVAAGLLLTALVFIGLRVGWVHQSKVRARFLALALVPIYLIAVWLVHNGGT